MLTEKEKKELEALKNDPAVRAGRRLNRDKQRLYNYRHLRKIGLAAKEGK